MKIVNRIDGVEVLSTATAIAKKIRWVLGNPKEKRLVLVAFVGEDPVRFIPYPKGLYLYCWPQVPGTNPRGLRDLRKHGVRLHGVERLHMKLYWSPSRGAVLGSANLSAGALTNGQNRELAVYLRPGAIDATAICRDLSARALTEGDIVALEEQYKAFQSLGKMDSITRKSIGRKHSATEETPRRKYKKRKQQFASRGIIVDDPPRLMRQGKQVVFTGKCAYGSRLACERAVRQDGGTVGSKVTVNTDILIIGALGSPHWTWTKYGKKMKKGAELRRHGGRPLIILEERWR